MAEEERMRTLAAIEDPDEPMLVSERAKELHAKLQGTTHVPEGSRERNDPDRPQRNGQCATD